jgi:cysteine desulfurase/selenocysteine lyase
MTVFTPTAKELNTVQVPFDVATIRADFPILARDVNGKPLVYLDNGASAQKPKVVLDTIQRAYGEEYANVHRGLHYLSNLSTVNFEKARESVRRFVNARSDEEIIFTRNATEAINLVASSYGAPNFGEGDEILITIMEHHSNIVPWHFLRERQGAVLKWVPVSDEGWSTERKARCTSRSTFRTSIVISMPSPATSCTGRPVSACSTARSNTLRPCGPIRAAAR